MELKQYQLDISIPLDKDAQRAYIHSQMLLIQEALGNIVVVLNDHDQRIEALEP